MKDLYPFLLVFLFSAFLNAECSLRFGDIEIDPGEEAAVPVMVHSDAAIHGFSMAFTYDGSVFSIKDFEINEDFVKKEDIGYSTILDKPGENYAIIGEILIWNEPDSQMGFPATGGEEKCLGWIVFSTGNGAQPGNYTIMPQNGLGSPNVPNIFSNAGQTIYPSLEKGSILIHNNNVLRIRSTYASAGGPATVLIDVDHKQPLAGMQVALSFDSTKLHLREDQPYSENMCDRSINPCGRVVETSLKPFSIEKFLLNIDNEYKSGKDRASCIMIFDYNPPFDDQVLSRGKRQTVLAAYFEVAPGLPEGTKIEIRFEDGLGDPPFFNKFLIPLYSEKKEIIDVASIFPVKENGTIQISNRVHPFRRGYVNNDDTLDLADPITLLDFIVGNTEEPACMSAADVNDDGMVNLADAVTLLGHLFLVDNSHLPEPFESCDFDPTPDGLSCYESPPGCN